LFYKKFKKNLADNCYRCNFTYIDRRFTVYTFQTMLMRQVCYFKKLVSNSNYIFLLLYTTLDSEKRH